MAATDFCQVSCLRRLPRRLGARAEIDRYYLRVVSQPATGTGTGEYQSALLQYVGPVRDLYGESHVPFDEQDRRAFGRCLHKEIVHRLRYLRSRAREFQVLADREGGENAPALVGWSESPCSQG